jgi:hypothetical protein
MDDGLHAAPWEREPTLTTTGNAHTLILLPFSYDLLHVTCERGEGK